MSYTCDQCPESFDSNYKLCSHKVETHVPVVGIINSNVESGNDNGVKRLLSSDEDKETGPPLKKPKLENRGVKRRKPMSFSQTSKHKKSRKHIEKRDGAIVNQRIKRKASSDIENDKTPKIQRNRKAKC